MGKQIKLPGGVLFDPETGEIQGGNFGRPPTVVRGLSQSARHNTYRRRYNLWDRFNNFISEIGDWIADHSEMMTNYCGMGLFVLSWIGFALSIISTWISQGFIWALIAGVIGGGIFYYISMILLGVFIFVMNIILAVIRYLFYNAYTFLIPIILIIAICLSNQINIPQTHTISVSNPTSLLPNYYCDVSSTLNVREYPRTNARVLGQLKRHEEVYVYSVDNNFAKIDFKGRVAYASADYLKPKGELTSINTSTQPVYKDKTTEASSKVNNANISATISRIWEEHNVFQDQQKGMKIHIKFNTYNMQNVQGKCIAYFYHKNGAALKDNNNSYRSSDGQVSVEQNFKPGYKEALYEDFILFIPYNELHLPSEGRTNLKVHVILQTSLTTAHPKKLATSDWIYFWYGKLE